MGAWMPKNLTPLEDVEQIKLSAWLTKQGIKHTASANGGKRNLLTAIKLKRMGLSAGFPDIFIPLPSDKYHGLFLEMKRIEGGKVSDSQQEWLNFLNNNGYYAQVAYGFDEAKEIVIYYLSLTKPAA